MTNRWGNNGNSGRLYFLGLQKITADGDCSHEIKMLVLWKKSYDKLRQCIKKQRNSFTYKGPYSQTYGFSSSHIWMWELDYEEAEHWGIYGFELWLEKTLESPLDSKEIQPVHPKGNQFCIFIGRTDAEAEAPTLWLPDANPLGKTLMLGKIEGRERRRQQRMRWLDGITDSMDMNLSKLR